MEWAKQLCTARGTSSSMGVVCPDDFQVWLSTSYVKFIHRSDMEPVRALLHKVFERAVASTGLSNALCSIQAAS